MTWRAVVGCILVAGATLFAVGAGFHFAVPVVAPGIPPQFGNAALFRPWAGWTSAYMAAHPFGFGVLFALAYLALRRRGAVAAGWRDGVLYGLGVFLVGSLPVYLLVFASFAVSAEVIACWVAQSACQYLIAGAVLGAVAATQPRLAGPLEPPEMAPVATGSSRTPSGADPTGGGR